MPAASDHASCPMALKGHHRDDVADELEILQAATAAFSRGALVLGVDVLVGRFVGHHRPQLIFRQESERWPGDEDHRARVEADEGVRHVDDLDGVHRRALRGLQDRRERGQLPPCAVVEVLDLALLGQASENLGSDGRRHRGWSALVQESSQCERIHREQLARTDGGQ